MLSVLMILPGNLCWKMKDAVRVGNLAGKVGLGKRYIFNVINRVGVKDVLKK